MTTNTKIYNNDLSTSISRLCLICCFVFIPLFSQGQLIKNGGFEDISFCRIDSLEHWELLNYIMHPVSAEISCNINIRTAKIETSIPEGDNAFFLHCYDVRTPRIHETFGQELSDTLINGQDYTLSFHSSLYTRGFDRQIELVIGFSKGKPLGGEVGDLYRDTLKIGYREEKWIKYFSCFTITDDSVNYISFKTYFRRNLSDPLPQLYFDDMQLNPTLGFDLGEDTSMCVGDTLVYDLYAPGITQYFWQGIGKPPSASSRYEITSPGIYWAGIQRECFIGTDTLEVFDVPEPTFEFEQDIDSLYCIGDTVLLNAAYPNASYRWQDNSTESTYSATEKGNYYVVITDVCGLTVSDSITLDYRERPQIDLGEDFTVCGGDSAIVVLDSTLSYVWQDGSTQNQFTILERGTFWVQATDDCGISVSDTLLIDDSPLTTINSIQYFNSVVLSTPQRGADHYQWIYCDSLVIPGANEPTFITSLNGSYALIADHKGCIDTSNCILVGIPEVEELSLKIFPNPTRKRVYIEYPDAYEEMELSIRNAAGQIINAKSAGADEELFIDLNGANGSYLLEIKVDQMDPQYYKVVKQ